MSTAPLAQNNEDDLLDYANRLCLDRLNAYDAAPHDAEEHANIETSVLAGGYAYRQVAELVQNAADAIADAGESGERGRILIEVDDEGLWAANTGAPVDRAGVRALLNAHASGKRAGQIGRFGLGFKSLLRLGGRIDVLSRSVCLLFDPEWCRTMIREHLDLAADAPAPGLRVASPRHWAPALTERPGAARFAWASTIVHAGLVAAGAREAVTEEMRRFPAEFLLFLPSDIDLVLKAGDVDRHLRRRTEPDGCLVIEDLNADRSAAQRWRVFQTSVQITDAAALEDATSVHARESVPLIWAAPAGGQRDLGRFYAFFPTNTETRTSGILNAPWKLNSDRTALIPGAWNSALMERAAELIASSLPELSSDADPAAVLDAFPRELGTLNEVAAPLVNALWERLVDAPVLPNCDGELLPPAQLHRPAVDGVDLTGLWAALASPEACETHLHPSCMASTARIGRLNQLAERLTPERSGAASPRLARIAPAAWLGAAATHDPGGAGKVLELAELYSRTVAAHVWSSIRDAVPIVLTAEGQLATAPEVALGEHPEPPLVPVHPELLADARSRTILQNVFQVRDDDETDWHRLMRVEALRAQGSGDWTAVWKLLRRMPWDEAVEAIESHVIEVRTRAGWADPDVVIRGSALVDPAAAGKLTSEQRAHLDGLLLDEEWHAKDGALLEELGIGAVGTVRWADWEAGDLADTPWGRWLNEWHRRWAARYHEKLNHRPDFSLLRARSFEMPAGWELLVLLDPPAATRVTDFLLDALAGGSSTGAMVEFRHSTRYDHYARDQYPHPLWDLIRLRGALGLGDATLAGASLLCADMLARAALVPALQPRMPALERLAASGGTWRTSTKDDVTWRDWLAFAAQDSRDTGELAAFYDLAARAGHVPVLVASPEGPIPIGNVRVSASVRDAEAAVRAGIPAIALSLTATSLWLEAGAQSLAAETQLSWTPAGDLNPALLLVDVEPMLRHAIRPEMHGVACMTLAETIDQLIGGVTVPVSWAIVEGRLIVRDPVWRAAGWADRVRLIAEGATACGWTVEGDAAATVLSNGAEHRRRTVASCPDLPSRLVRACGEAAVLSLFEADVRQEFGQDALRAADTALTLFGPALLTIPGIRAALASEGLDPPARWGGEAAMAFVAEIGFPAAFAAPPDRRRDPEVAVSGPIPLKPLHDFQEDVVGHIDALLADRSSPRRRAVVSLPTGAGKTRVAAQTAVTRILAPAQGNRLVLWVAQSDELCEQAVQCFRELWSNLGTAGETLRIVRFWGGQVNPRPSVDAEPTVIVASIQTLTARIIDEDLAWASDPALLVIDECHHALTPSYTGALRWLNPEARREGREPPIVGLSATPFRGRNEDESAQLARRFDGRLIPSNQGGLFEALQARGVLARFAYTRLEIDAAFTLTPEEQWRLEKFRTVPDTALERLGENRERNDLIVDAICAAPEKSALVFATSVAHARRLAARLNLRGVKAAAVTGETDRGSRRWFISAFRSGEIRVLCNHSALATGFDAPATDLIVIARPVFSPSLYMQMAGRGLRGPVNGGKDECRILTVQDNLDQYTGMLAHHYFEQHYVQ